MSTFDDLSRTVSEESVRCHHTWSYAALAGGLCSPERRDNRVAGSVTVSETLYDDLGMVEPRFHVRLAHEVIEDRDVPDEVGLAIGRAAGRLYDVTTDGREAENEGEGEHRIEGVMGPFVDEGGLSIYLDTDGFGATREMVAAIGRIFVEELTPTGIEAYIDVALGLIDGYPPMWRSSGGRE
jgi:hypothetical protein